MPKKTVLLTRPEQQAESTAMCLESLGFRVLHQPLIRIVAYDDPIHPGRFDDLVQTLLGESPVYDWLIFSSRNGVRFFAERLARHLAAAGIKSPGINNAIRIAVVGPGTAEATREQLHREPTIVSPKGSAEEMLDLLCREPLAKKRFLLLRGDRGRSLIPETLTSLGAIVEEWAIYRTIEISRISPEIVQMLRAGQIDFITVTSSAIAESLVRLLGDDLGRSRLVSISPLTSQRLIQLGFSPALEAAEATIEAVINCIVHHEQGL